MRRDSNQPTQTQREGERGTVPLSLCECESIICSVHDAEHSCRSTTKLMRYSVAGYKQTLCRECANVALFYCLDSNYAFSTEQPEAQQTAADPQFAAARIRACWEYLNNIWRTKGPDAAQDEIATLIGR